MLDEGIRIALPEARTVGYVEREAHAEAILLARMADAALEQAPVWCGPLEDFQSREWRGAVDCITAGFPCQPWSAAGRQLGEADDRWIWPAISRIIDDSETPTVFLENVPGLVVGLGLNRVLGDLAALGFDAEWCCVSAADVGAAHLRERIFILAVDASRGRGILRQSSCDFSLGRFTDGSDQDLEDAARLLGGERTGRERVQHAGEELGDTISVDAERRRVARVLAGANFGTEIARDQRERGGSSARPGGSAMADASVGLVSLEGRRSCGRDGAGPAGTDVLAHAGFDERRPGKFRSEEGTRPNGIGRKRSGGGRAALADCESERSQGIGEGRPETRPIGRSGGADIFAPGPSDPRWPEILREHGYLSPAVAAGSVRVWWDDASRSLKAETSESGFRCLVDGHAVVVDEHRADQLRAIGNGVVALSAAVAFAVLSRRLLT